MDIVSTGERIETAIKVGRTKSISTENGLGKKWTSKKKEEEVQMVQRQQYQREHGPGARRNFAFEPSVNQTVHTGGRPQVVPSRTMPTQPNVRTHDRGIQRNTRRIDPIPMTYSELFPQLMERNLVSVIPGMVITAPYPQWYDPEAKCAYANTPGHTIEQEGMNEVDFEQMSLDWVFNELIAAGRIGQEAVCPTNALCLCQSKEGRSVKKCVTFRMFLQKMVDNKFIEISCTHKIGEIVVVGENRPVYHQWTNQPFIPTMNKALPTQEAPARLVISTPRPFPYKSNQAVPWKYECEAYIEGSTSNIAGVKGITRSGRVYMPDSSKTNRQNAGEPDRAVKSPISNGEAEEFLKIIKHSEYNIVDQLKKMPAHISVLSLLLNSETHREALLKVLNQAYIPHDISVDKFNHVIGSLAASNYITFTDEEIPPEGQGHNKALHISTKCKDHMMS
ncbi:uncharacterized protein LOC131158651 [Malania oleifera]|uniref:uncharacterized protein LOC131158651 n=1 Tax=Malania oleifera TaxID=397392 RepID=UPI0025AE3F39|nr:uncharacterized protein LOC131158651 [Malania oleifera]